MRRLLAPLSRWLDRRIDARIDARERDLDTLLRSTWAGLGPEMRSVFGSEEGFRRRLLSGECELTAGHRQLADFVADAFRDASALKRGGDWMGA